MTSVLNESNYFSKENELRYMGVSQYKAFRSCQASALAAVRGEYERKKTTALTVGSYIDAHFSGTMVLFRAQNPEIYKRDGSLKSDYEQADYIISRIESQPLMMELLSGEHQVILTGEIAGIEVKIKIDSLLPDRICDLKIMRDFAPVYREEEGRLPWYEAWGYDTQGAVYQEIVRQNTGRKLPFTLVAATKEEEPDLDVLELSQELLDYELEQFRQNAPVYDAVKHGVFPPERCEKCAFCRRTKTVNTIHTSEDEL
ncbi:MAG: PD-(D/E)XK nuclease-like domain-containing protein [Lachnospiraceae bacterium]